MNSIEVAIFIMYLVCMLCIGAYFYRNANEGGDKQYFLGGRQMGSWVAALSAGASDMSAWVLMGLPTAIYALGLGQLWIAIGLLGGYTISWLYEAPRLRAFSVVYGDSITVPQFLTNRFLSKSKSLQVVSAVVFLIAYTIYAASSIKACGILFNTVMGLDATWAMFLGAFVIVSYTFLGGFKAVCWTDFVQGLIMLGAMFIAPIFAASMVQGGADVSIPASYWSLTADWHDVISGLAWGFGYFGMPHIIVRFMSLEKQSEIKKSAVIGIGWTAFILLFAAAIGVIGRLFLGFDDGINANSLVFITMVRRIFPAVISGILLSAVLAASMSTADSQLLAAGSAFASDVYKPVIRKNSASEKEMMWVGRIVVLVIAVLAMMIAIAPNSGSIMSLVSNAWGVFGAAFGPAIMLSLFWKRFNFTGAVAGIVAGTVVDIGWLMYLSDTHIYELFPAYIVGAVVAYVAALLTAPPEQAVVAKYNEAEEKVLKGLN
ncbi:MAG: sodium/proline symporter [Phascolarctobacterium sp.]|nr:sodium/proline symporter [Candidatus Phascolarctobacterium caballi]